MRVMPPKYYNGKIPDGYEKKQFFRFDQRNGETYGVLYSGERININAIKYKPSLAERAWATVKKPFIQLMGA